MLKKDAIVKDSDGEICTVSIVHDYGITVEYGGRHSEDSDLLEHGTYEVLEDIRSMHEQEKERADKAEERIEEVTDFWMNVSEQYKQRWSTLNKKIKERNEYLENMAIECMDNIDEAVKWNAAKHEVLMIMKDMHDLEEDGE